MTGNLGHRIKKADQKAIRMGLEALSTLVGLFCLIAEIQGVIHRSTLLRHPTVIILTLTFLPRFLTPYHPSS